MLRSEHADTDQDGLDQDGQNATAVGPPDSGRRERPNDRVFPGEYGRSVTIARLAGKGLRGRDGGPTSPKRVAGVIEANAAADVSPCPSAPDSC